LRLLLRGRTGLAARGGLLALNGGKITGRLTLTERDAERPFLDQPRRAGFLAHLANARQTFGYRQRQRCRKVGIFRRNSRVAFDRLAGNRVDRRIDWRGDKAHRAHRRVAGALRDVHRTTRVRKLLHAARHLIP
jgi:hypothetical protein